MKNLSKNMPRTLLPALLALLVVSGAAVAQTAPIPATPSPGFGRYVLVLWESGTPIPTNPGQHLGPITEPNVTSLGGTLLRSTGNRRLIDLPVTAAAELRAHPSVKYMQRLWMGEPLEELDEESATARRPGIASEDDPSSWGPRAYVYDGSGNIQEFGDDSYTYDTANRLIQAELGPRTEKYKYDAFGNLVEMAIDGTTPVAIPVDPGSNRLMGKRYDQAGNVAEGKKGPYQYDSLNMLVQYGPYAKIYDANDEQIASINAGSQDLDLHYTVRDFDGRVLREFYSPDSNTCLWKQDYVYGETQLVGGEAVQLQVQTSQGTQTYGGIRHYHLDHLGSVRMVTDTSGRSTSESDYYPFGIEATPRNQDYALLADSEIDSARFASHHRDFAGALNTENRDYLDYMHARYYDPGMGRFLSVDPTWDSADLGKPQTWNRYSYVLNNPVNLTDPDGKQAFGPMVRSSSNWRLYQEGKITRAELERRETTTTTGGLIGMALPRLVTMLASWVLGNPNQARQVLDAVVSPPNSSAFPSPEAIGAEIGDRVAGRATGKMATIATEISAIQMSQAGAANAVNSAVQAMGMRTTGVMKVGEDLVVGSILLGANKPVLVIDSQGVVRYATATIEAAEKTADIVIKDLKY